MAFKCGFFNSINGDRKYGADEMMNPIKGIVSEGVVADDKYSDGLQVQAFEGLEVAVKKGNGHFFGKWCELDADMILTVSMPHVTNIRIDSVVVRIDNNNEVRSGSIYIKTGNLNAPELENTALVKEYRLANIIVNPNVAKITQADIEDTRPSAECGFVTNLLQNSDITATYAQWKKQFNDWFINLKETIASKTLITSFTSRYVTTEQDETVIPIGISQYTSVLDILQVYINNLLCFEGTDYTVDGFNNVVLTDGVDIGTEIHFVIYKSVDGTGIDKYVENVDDLVERQSFLESNVTDFKSNVSTDISAFKTKVNTENDAFKANVNSQISTIDSKLINNTQKVSEVEIATHTLQSEINNLKKDLSSPLWSGGKAMGSADTITPSKKLSQCKNGYILAWCGYNNNSYSNTRFNFITVPKGCLAAIPGNSVPVYNHLVYTIYESGTFEECVKRVDVYDDKIVGFVGNTATDLNSGMCLRFVFEY